MARVCVILVAGLDAAIVKHPAATLATFPHRKTFEPDFPAVTSTMQATLTTAVSARQHGITANGLYTHSQPALHANLDLSNYADYRKDVSFWEQSNNLLQHQRFWAGSGKKVAMLFLQNSMHGAADIVITPKPEHTPDGKTLTACWSNPPELYAKLVAKFGPFPLHNYWSPMAGLPSSQWIINAALHVWSEDQPDLQLVYVPHLDYNLQRLGPSHPAIAKELADVDAAIAPLVKLVRESGGIPVVVGDYGMYDVDTPLFPNLVLREAGLLKTKTDDKGKVYVDYAASEAFALCDHQVAHIFTRSPMAATRVLKEKLTALDNITHMQTERAGAFTLVAKPNAWFAHDWWQHDGEKPLWQFTVDIHAKPGYDPRELFLDRERKCIAQDAKLVKGSHGRNTEPDKWPVLLSDAPIDSADRAYNIAAWLKGHLRS